MTATYPKNGFAKSSGSSNVEAGNERCDRFLLSATSIFEGVSFGLLSISDGFFGIARIPQCPED
ncbi:hypothetical protein [Aureimonas leprariae]|uniref:hypothetical protein n=1 Tax=Plantimonas leprariae TaxID=2615207 RepID=UPI00192A2BA5|nr:hypothetical protein [Aureimonas leprariae]